MKKICWALQIKGTNKFVARMYLFHWEACTTVLFRTRKQADEWLDTQDHGYWKQRAYPIKVKVHIMEAFSTNGDVKK